MKNDNRESTCPDFERLGLIMSSVMQNISTFSSAYKNNEICTSDEHTKCKVITSGISNLDSLLGEFHRGGLYSLCGHPGMGKTALMLDMILNISQSSCVPIYLITLESSKEQVAIRLLQKLTGVPISAIRNACALNNELKCLVDKCLSVMDKLNIFICDKAPCRTSDIHRIVEGNVHDGIIFIDYIQLLSSEKDVCKNSAYELCESVTCLKQLARSCKIPIVVTSQLSRQIGTGTDKRPCLADLDNCGALVRGSDGIVLIYRNDYYEDKSNLAELNLVKNNYGKVGAVAASYDCKRVSFT